MAIPTAHADHSTARPSRCRPEKPDSVSLPVLPGGGGSGDARHGGLIRRSRNAPKRAIVLALVHLLLVAHVVHWAVTGSPTTTPIEPSESMEFSRYGIINVGLIFFAVALLSTLFFGRWFCGWGCHVVLLQDLCGWMMKKLGIRPKPFRSRFLIYVPLILAVYMFIWPAVYRLGVAPIVGTAEAMRPWQIELHLTTTDFWRTFPGLMVAIPFLLICGFATVYFLGAKGFCTYGCPYGGFFAPVDKYAPGRIRVTDDCEQCGHCTAVCTSNVRVHDEVREYGMVVDPGCMKCLDCVSVCPKNALYFGFGRPAITKGQPKNSPPKRVYDMTLKEEFAIGAVFLGAFLAWRGIYGVIPMLMAAGIAGCVAFLGWKLWRLMRDANVGFHRMRLKYHGKLAAAGWLFAIIAAAAVIWTAHTGVVQAAVTAGQFFDDRIAVSRDLVFGVGNDQVPSEAKENARKALRWFDLGSSVVDGGIGLLTTWQAELDIRRAWLHSVRGEFAEAEAMLRGSLARFGPNERLSEGLALVLVAQDRPVEAIESMAEVLREQRTFHLLLDQFVQWSDGAGMQEQAYELLRARLEKFPDDAPTMRWLGLVHLDRHEVNEGLSLLEQAVDADPSHLGGYSTLALALASFGRPEQAHGVLKRALEREPEYLPFNQQMAMLLRGMNRPEEAHEYEQKVQKLQQQGVGLHPQGEYDSPLVP